MLHFLRPKSQYATSQQFTLGRAATPLAKCLRGGILCRKHGIFAQAILGHRVDVAAQLGGWRSHVLTCPRYYTGHAILIVDAPKTQFFQSRSSPRDVPIDSAIVDTQIQILNSDDIALSVIKELHLDEDPEFTLSSNGVLGAVTRYINNAIDGVLRTSSEQQSTESRALQTFHRRLKVRRVALTYAIEISLNRETLIAPRRSRMRSPMPTSSLRLRPNTR